ncbi:hypothetical protein ACN38_g12255, partial [Penicillium nordicum]
FRFSSDSVQIQFRFSSDLIYVRSPYFIPDWVYHDYASCEIQTICLN